jgi:hypothetical protein
MAADVTDTPSSALLMAGSNSGGSNRDKAVVAAQRIEITAAQGRKSRLLNGWMKCTGAKVRQTRIKTIPAASAGCTGINTK